MKMPKHNRTSLIAIVSASVLMAACASNKPPEGSADVREKLTRLQTNQPLASRAPVAIKEAEAAVRAAEVPEKDTDLAKHRVFMADRKVDIAASQAQGRLYEDQRTELARESERARLESRTREADQAHVEATQAQREAREAQLAASQAREEAEAERLKNQQLLKELEELNAKQTDRGMVVTLGDVLFATGRAELTANAAGNLNKLAAFFKEHQDRIAVVEGHTDSVGSESSNFALSQRRADSVKAYLVSQGVAADRLQTRGMGQGSPVAGNDTAMGRQQNRRVEIIVNQAPQ